MSDDKINQMHREHPELEILDWQPSHDQMLAKAAMWGSLEGDWRTPEDLTINEMAQRCDVHWRKFQDWWALPQFRSWLLNKDLARQKIMALAELAVDGLAKAMLEPNTVTKRGGISWASKIRAMELILNFSGLQPARKVEIDSKIGQLAPAERQAMLQANIRKYIQQLPPDERAALLSEGDTDEVEDTGVVVSD